ncbi:MAG: DUF4249 family protein [Prolixibacteraceae bacterium]|jgi:hypothetical protein|nr:DUF4249 family protein [Prolixibacteraceae bacterium]MBT6005606.1 DUF4249 family protein [Prolixibacteraceae bacterium]MBT6765292.1 DUF4249 family protein [Prolixibacteraceae bacterium]MBT6996920.1 DUF4249 family protein [Prolixibacteraceae bacterium]MBT7396952.1 DUF4249 family protein [Prolixibacteraceae bacterium]
MKLKQIVIIILVFLGVSSCLEPFNVTIGDENTTFLVVDGLITNENTSHSVKLTRSLSNINEDIIPEVGAELIIEDDFGKETTLRETKRGVYQTNPDDFIGIPGRTYRLIIKTKKGERYHSSPCLMPPPSDINDVYYIPANNTIGDSSNKLNGVGIYVDGQINTDEIQYLRWAYEEDWKFYIPFGHHEVLLPDNTWEPISPKKYCWKSSVSNEILLYSFNNQTEQQVIGKELYFIAANESDRLIDRYSTLIKQYSITKEEYDFWRKIQQSDPGVSGIFGDQPFSIKGNITNTNNPEEKALGYFQVAGVATKRIYIDYGKIQNLKIAVNNEFSNCNYTPFILDSLNAGGTTENPEYEDIYSILKKFVLSGDYSYEFAFPIIHPAPLNQTVIGLALSSAKCTDCTLSGEINPPEFWEEQ